MNAIPERVLVDVSAPEERRAGQVQALCRQLARSYYPHQDERSDAMTRQLSFTLWYGSAHATDRRASLFALTPEHVQSVRSVLLRPVYQHDLARFLSVTGMSREAFLRLAENDLIGLAANDDLLAASLAVEIYRLGGPLPWRRDVQACAATWFSRFCLLRGIERERNQELRLRQFVSEAEHLLGVLGQKISGP